MGDCRGVWLNVDQSTCSCQLELEQPVAVPANDPADSNAVTAVAWQTDTVRTSLQQSMTPSTFVSTIASKSSSSLSSKH